MAIALLGSGGALAAPTPANAAPAADRSEAGRPADRSEAGRRPGYWRFDQSSTTLAQAAGVVGADRLWADGVTGRGVGVALVDTGVVPVPGLTSGNVVNGPDLSLESQAPNLRYLDTYGHGTHLAGIIAGNDPASGFRGVAPGATLTSVKVGTASGAVDVSQVIAAVDWVVAHRDDDPARPIRVLTLAYGTDSRQDYRIDPLAHAVENAWRAGIVVVIAGGNGGTAAPSLTNPATDPHVIAVGSTDLNGTDRTNDDVVSDFSSRGNASRRVDLVAPGRSIVSLRDPGGTADTTYPAARVGDQLFKGSGTSQSAAVVSGAVALLLEHRPELTPDAVKGLLTGTAVRLPRADPAGQGAGELNIARAARVQRPVPAQRWTPSTGTGSLEAARGSAHLHLGGATLTGENDLFGPFDTTAWAAASTAGTAWVGGRWMGNGWAGDGYDGQSWTGRTWSGRTWSDSSWSDTSWSDSSWSDTSWSDTSWSDSSWSDSSWSDSSWSDSSWSDSSWSAAAWR